MVATDINMAPFVAAAAEGGAQSQALHDSFYAVALVVIGGVALWTAQQFFGGMITGFGSKSADSLAAGFLSHGRIFGGRRRRYRRAIQRNYAGHAPGFGGSEVIDIRAVYVPLRSQEAGRREDIYARIRDEPRSLVLGFAGAGKSLLLKNSMLIWADDLRPRPWHRDDRRVPVLVELHRCNDSDADIPQLALDELARNQVRRPKSFVERALRDGRLRLLLDGLDEVGRDRQERVVTMIRDFARANPDCQIVVTCRDAVYYGQLSPEFQHVVRIAEFDDASIRRLLGNWPGIDRLDVDNLVGALRANPQLMHLARNPLLLTMIAYLYVSKFAKSGESLPSSRVTFYETAITHLLDRDQALVRAASLSVYDAGDKLAALQRIAAAMQEGASGRAADRMEISQAAAIATTRSALPALSLGENEARPLFQEIVDRSQLLISLDRPRSRYSFRHLTLQEYLAARELADRPDDLLRGYLADPDGWREVVKLWCGVTTRNSTDVVREVLAFGAPRDQALALECLAEARYLDDTFAREVISRFIGMLGPADSTGQVLIAGFGALAAAEGPRGRSVLRQLVSLTGPTGSAAEEDTRRAAISALCASGRQEAAEVLARLAPADEAARAALRAMGELAIPVLERRAAAGDVEAVDDLAFIGTPAAAESIAGLLRIDDPAGAPGETAVTAAWRLAELLADSDVEEGLKASGFQIPDGVPSYDWVWKPFALSPDQDGPIGWIIGRAALLIDQSPDFVPSAPRAVDQRIAIPLAGIKVGTRVRELPVNALSDAVDQFDSDAEAFLLSESRGLGAPLSPEGISFAGNVVRALGLPSAHRHLVEHLPWPVEARLLAAAFNGRISRTDSRDWLEVQQDPKPAKGLFRFYGTLLGAALIGGGVFATFWQIEVLRGVAHIGPSWFYIAAPCVFEGSLVVLLAVFTVMLLTVFGLIGRRDETPGFMVHLFVFMCGVLVTMVGGVLDVCVSGLLLSSWFGPTAITSPFAAVAGATGLIGWLANRRERRYGNPLRHCVRASGRSFADRTSVIA